MSSSQKPWYRRVYRWGQTNLTEIDPVRYDAEWWRQHWRRTKVQGVIVNAGGIVFYYPSQYKEVHHALYLGDRDLYGEINSIAREEGLAVLARMDSNRVHRRFYLEHPDWCARDENGDPYRAGELYVTCVNSPYYTEFIPNILKEIVRRYQPDGITDNSYSGLSRDHICYCHNCDAQFKEATGYDLPHKKDWNDPVYRQWIKWSYACRVRNWDINNEATKSVGGEDCLWIGMNSGDMVSQGVRLRDSKAIFERCKIVMADHQSRPMVPGFRHNSEAGKIIHSLAGWDVLIPESMAMYQHGHGQPTFRLASKPESEVRMWAVEGFAGTIQPWWHHIGAYHEDRRQYRFAESLFKWHEKNEEILVNRKPIANVGVIWSQENADFYGQDHAQTRVVEPYAGVTQALTRARIPYLPIHADHIERDSANLDVLILPNVGGLSDSQVAAIRTFVEKGGSLIATGESSLYDEWGARRKDFALADVFGVNIRHAHHGFVSFNKQSWETWDQHSYLRLLPEIRARVYGPLLGDEPDASGERHQALEGFEETDLLPFGGRLQLVEAQPGTHTLMTYVPEFPIYPPETSWMREPRTSLPGVVLRELESGGRVAYLAADVDRLYGRDNLPDHGKLLSNIIRWTARNQFPIEVEATGYLDVHLYNQPGRLILHVVNLTNTEAWRAAVHELIPVGPVGIKVKLPEDVKVDSVSLRVAEVDIKSDVSAGWVRFEIPSITDHEVVVIS